MTSRLLLIDGHSIAFRAFYALPVENFSTATGQPTNAVYGFTSMLINALRDIDPSHVAVCFDVSRHSFRTDSYADYKATRGATPPEFNGQVDLIKQVLDALAISHLEKEEFEADDLIATLATRADGEGYDVDIISGDRDAFQLVNEHVTVLAPNKGVSSMARMDAEAIEDKYGVPPQRYRQLAALVGESSDNLPGVKGVGPKTAAKWISTYDGLDNLLANPELVGGKVGQAFRDQIDDVKRNYELNRLIRDVEIDASLDEFARRPFDRDAVHQVFDALEFLTLRRRLFDTFGDDDAKAASGSYELTVGSVGLSTWLAENAAQGPVGLDIACDGRADIASIAVATADNSAYWLDPAELSPEDEASFVSWLADPQITKVMHAAKLAMHAARARGWEIAGLSCDTELAAYLLRPDQRGYDVADLALRYLKREIVPPEQANQASLVSDGSDQMIRARAVIDLAETLVAELKRDGQDELLVTMEMPLQQVLFEMEAVGVAVDTAALDALREDFDTRVRDAQQGAFDAVGHELNLSSPKQLQQVLFDELGLPKTKKIKSGYTTDAEALAGLFARTEHPFLAHLLAHRDAIKMRQSVEGLIKAVADDGRIHTTFMQTIAATGRLSSTEPNLQNIPIRTPEGRQIRGAFIAGDGFEGLMSADYSQIEMRVMADGSGDPHLIHAFESGADFHAMTAARVFDKEIEDVTPDERSSVKQMNYGLAYGLSAFGLSSRLGISVGRARDLMDDYFATFGAVRTYLNEIVADARRRGFTSTIAGRRRYLPDLNSSNRRRREMAERAALNAPIQGSAADIIKRAMLNVAECLSRHGMASRMLLQIHDELLVEVAPGEREAVEELLRTQMRGAASLAVPLDVSIGYGDTWLSAAH